MQTHGRPPLARWEVASVVAAMLVVAVIGGIAIGQGAPLLWDEAVYGLRVREIVEASVRGEYWIEVRAPGLPALLAPAGMLLGTSAAALRAATLVFAMIGIAATWLIARELLDPVHAAVAAWLLALAPGWHESSWQVMPDIPGATLTLSAMAIILMAGRGDRLRWWALLAAPLAAAATLVRYGAPLLIAPTVVVALLLRWPAVMATRMRAAVVLAASGVATAVVWFVPQVTGSSRAPVLIFAARQDNKAIPALQSATDFVTRLGQMVGPVFGLLVVVGAACAVVAVRKRHALAGPTIACGAIAVGVLLLMLVGIAQYNVRYLAPSAPFLAIVVAVGLVHVAQRLSPAVVITAACTIGLAGVGVAGLTAVDRAGFMTERFGPVRVAYDEITAATDGPCVVLDHNPSAEWYTGCASLRPMYLGNLAARRATEARITADEPTFAVIRDWPNRGNPSAQPAAVLEQLAVATDRVPSVTILDLGTFGRMAEGLDAHVSAATP